MKDSYLLRVLNQLGVQRGDSFLRILLLLGPKFYIKFLFRSLKSLK